jgi:hypothetical protein
MKPEERAAAVLGEVDGLARDYDHYEYGLPMAEGEQAKMVAVVATAIREAEAAMKERCAAVADSEAIHPAWLGDPALGLSDSARRIAAAIRALDTTPASSPAGPPATGG